MDKAELISKLKDIKIRKLELRQKAMDLKMADGKRTDELQALIKEAGIVAADATSADLEDMLIDALEKFQ